MKFIAKYLFASIILCLSSVVYAANYNEIDFNKEVCIFIGGADNYTKVIANYKLKPDCVTSDYAMEADWGYKATYEGVGQALAYSVATNKEPFVIIYIRTEDNKLKNKDLKGLALFQGLYDPDKKGYTDIEYMVIETNRDTGEWSIIKNKRRTK